MSPLRLLLLLLPVALPEAAIAAEQDDLTAAIVYNIIRFTQFQPPPGDHVTLCVRGSAALTDAFGRMDGRAVPNGRLAVRTLAHGDTPAGCFVTFLDGESRPPADGGGLTISDAPHFARNGGSVGLFRFGRQVLFELNTQAAARHGVHFSSRLLNLAAVVHAR